jgi:DNA topoisomerase IB
MIAPDWTDVRVYPHSNSEVWVEARDNKGRIKTVYRPEYQQSQAEAKFLRIRELLLESASLHAENQKNRESEDPRVREAADCLWLIEIQGLRPGSNRDTKSKTKAYGATTLQAEHVVHAPEGVRLQFAGKEGIAQDHLIHDPQLAKMLVDRKSAAGQRGGRLFAVDDGDLRRYVASLDSGRFLPKDFRTKLANQIAIREISQCARAPATSRERQRAIKAVAEAVSRVLGNRPSQCVESYIDPALWSVWPMPQPANTAKTRRRRSAQAAAL